jgi:acetyltransferase
MTTEVSSKLGLEERKKFQFDSLFFPQTIAIIGASKNRLGGFKYNMALEDWGYKGQVFLINPNHDELFGIKCYPTIDDPEIPKPVDLVIISVPNTLTPGVIRTLNSSNAKFATIFSSGFIESDNKDLDDDLHNAIESSDTIFIGPNCLGVLNPGVGLAIYPQIECFPGHFSMFAQSGGNMIRSYMFLGSIGIGSRFCCGIGNMYDLAPHELIRYYGQDPETNVIGVYMESMIHGRQFMEAAKEVALKKPIVIWKGGQTERGNEAARSHTGGLAGSFEVWKGMAKQCGIMIATYFEQFIDMVQVASLRLPPPKNLNVCILVAGGGVGVEFTDVFESAGFKVIDLQQETKDALAEVFPAVNTSFKNPIDLGEHGYIPEKFAKAVQIVSTDINIGSIVFVREPDRFPIYQTLLGFENMQESTINSLVPILQSIDKPVICTPAANRDFVGDFENRHNFQTAMIAAGLPLIQNVSNIPPVLLQLYYYGKFLDHNKKD